jgi:hypothetical protein
LTTVDRYVRENASSEADAILNDLGVKEGVKPVHIGKQGRQRFRVFLCIGNARLS